MNMLNGIDVVIREPIPKMTLSPNVPVTDEFRQKTNAWLAEFFGYWPDYVWHSTRDNRLFMSSATWEKLKTAIDKQGIKS